MASRRKRRREAGSLWDDVSHYSRKSNVILGDYKLMPKFTCKSKLEITEDRQFVTKASMIKNKRAP